jgi:plasmid rolling circle replication initiator protein Rep
MKWRARLIKGLGELIQAYPDYQFLFLTLTIRNCPVESLRAEIDRMVKGWHNLCHKKEFPAVGYVRSLEVTRNPETGECHPHFHCLLVVPQSYFTGKYYLSQVRWTELWRESAGLNYTPIVNVKKVKDRRKKASQLDPLEGQGKIKTDLDLDLGILTAILETAKYCVKPEDLLADPDWLVRVADQIFRLRKTVTGGLIRQFVNDREDDSDLIHITEEETISEHDYSLIFDWWSIVQKYLQREEDT